MDAARSYWPIGYDEFESYYDKFDGVCGAWGGDIFEAPRSSEFPNPPLTPSHNMLSFERAARDLGYQSFAVPAPLPRVQSSDHPEFAKLDFVGGEWQGQARNN